MIIAKKRLNSAVIASVVFGLIGYNFINAAWTPPPAGVPPANNIDAPLNTGIDSQIKLGALGTGALSVTGNMAVSNTLSIVNQNPFIYLNDTTQNENSFWLHANTNAFYLLADRNKDAVWDSPNPFVVFTGATQADDYAAFSNKVRAKEYCNEVGGNCKSASALGGAGTVNFFNLFGGSGVTSTSTNIGGNWLICALSKQQTTADDNNMWDHCEVRKEQNGNWTLLLNKVQQDTLTCGAVCARL